MKVLDKYCAAASSALAVLMVGAACAHDFWLEPSEFSAAPGETIRINFMVGHGDDLVHWNLTERNAASFTLYTPESGPENAADALKMGREDGGGFIIPKTPGVHVAAFQSNPVYIELAADKFNSYVKEEGLAMIAAHRAEGDLNAEPGRELYSRRAKTIFRAGDNMDDEASTALVGQTLEIRLLKSPFALAPNETLPVQVYFEGKPLGGASISLENLRLGILPEAVKITDDEGVAEFALPKKGAWKLNTVWATPLQGDDRAEYETIFSSLTFSYD